MASNPDGSLAVLLEDCADAATDMLAPAPAWSRGEFTVLRDRVAGALIPTTLDVVARTEKVLAALQAVRLTLPEKPPPAHVAAIADIRPQLGGLLPVGFVTTTGVAGLADLTRYITALGRRLERLPATPPVTASGCSGCIP